MYKPQAGYADAINLALTKKPGRTAGRIAGREGSKLVVSNMGDTFYNNGRFTGTGGATYGAASGVIGSALNGGDAGDMAAGGAIGGASSGLADYVAGQGASEAGAGALGGAVGFTGSIVKDAFSNHHKRQVSGAEMGGRFAGAIGNAVGGPLAGAIIGMGMSKLLGAGGPKRRYVRGTLETNGPLFKYDPKSHTFIRSGKITGFNGGGFHHESVPKKYWNKIARAGERRANYVGKMLQGKTFNLDDTRAQQMEHYINSNTLKLPESKKTPITSWMRNPASNLPDFNRVITELSNNPTAYLTRYGKIDDSSLYDGTDEGGDMAPEAWMPADPSKDYSPSGRWLGSEDD